MKSLLFKNTLFVTISRIFIHLSGLIIVMMITRSLSKNQIGTYNQIFTIVEISSILVFGFPEAIVYYCSTKNVDSKKTINTIFSFILCIIILIFTIFVLFGKYVSNYFENIELSRYKVNIAILLSSAMFNLCFSNYCVVYNKVKLLSISSTLFSFFRLFIAFFTFINLINFDTFIESVTFLYLIIFIFQFTEIILIAKPKLNFSLKELKRILIYSMPLWISSLVGTLSKILDKLVVGRFTSTEDFAIYSTVAKELPYTIVTSVFVTLTTPIIIQLISNNKKKEAVFLWKKTVIYQTYFLFFVVFSNIFMSKELITFLYSDKYISGYPVFIIYLLVLLSRIIYWGMFSKAYNKSKYIVYITIVTLLIDFVLNLILIRTIGMIGPAIGTLISTIIGCILYHFVNKKLLVISSKELYPIKEIINCFFINCIILVMMFPLKKLILDQLPISEFIKLATVAIIWLLIYCVFYRKDVKYILKNASVLFKNVPK